MGDKNVILNLNEETFMEKTKGDFLKKNFLGFLGIVILLMEVIFIGCMPEPGKDDSSGSVKHIILFIGDGMELEDEIATSRYLYGDDYGLIWHNFPYQTYMSTWDVSSYNVYANYFEVPPYDEVSFDPLVGYDPSWGGIAPYPVDRTGDIPYLTGTATDSASSATAFATGFKTDSGNISWLRGDPDDGALTTIAELLRAQKGGAIGVVSTVPFSHATPAGFVSHNKSRGNYIQIAEEIISQTKPEVVIGGGHPNWCGNTYISADQLDGLRNSTEYVLVERVSGEDGGVNLLYTAQSLPLDKKLFGLFGGTGCNFEPPVPRDNPGYPGFVIESENPSLAEATESALIVLSRDEDGFFLMVESGDIDWANHANNFSQMVGTVWALEEAVIRAINFVEMPNDDIDWTNTLIIITADHSTGGLRLNDDLVLGKGDLPAQNGSSYPDGELIYLSGSHTNQLVTFYAKGRGLDLFRKYEGAWYPGTKIIDNTQVFMLMAEALGLTQ